MTSVWIDAMSATTGGALTVSRGLAAGLAEVRPEWDVLMTCSIEDAAPGDAPGNLSVEVVPSSRRLMARLVREQLVAPFSRRLAGVDAFLLLGGFVPLLARQKSVAVWQNANIWTLAPAEMTPSLRRYIAIQRLMMKLSVERAAQNVFLSADSLSRCREMITLPNERAVVIPLGIDSLEKQAHSPRGWEGREDLILTVGDLYPHKGHDLIIRALALIARELPTIRLMIVGREVSEGRAASLLQLAADLGVRDRLELPGFLDKEEVMALYGRARVYVNASRLESFGLTPIEAMSCATPVISSTESASPEICGDAALYFETYDAQSLASRLRDLTTSRSEWDQRSAAVLRRARRFDWRSVAQSYAELIEALGGTSTRR